MPYQGCDGGDCTQQAGDHLNADTLMSIIANAGYSAGVLTYDPAKKQVNRPTLLINATAVTLHESDGWSQACNPTSGTVGIWQFQPRFFDKGRACDPQSASTMFFEVWKDSGWHPWAGDITGARWSDGVLTGAKDREAQAKAAYVNFTGGDPGSTEECPWWDAFCLFTKPGGVFTVVEAVAKFASEVGFGIAWLTSGQNWIRLGEAVAGGILVLFALWLLAKRADLVPNVVPVPIPI